MSLVNTLSLDQAFNRGHQSWTARIAGWGNFGTPAGNVPQFVQAISRPIVGVQIHPLSTVSEVLVEFDEGSGITFPTVGPDHLSIEENVLYVRRGRPYFWRTPATINIRSTIATQYGDLYFPTGAATLATTAPFGQAIGGTIFQAPMLYLTVFFSDTPAAREAPMVPWTDVVQNLVLLNNTAETVASIRPSLHYEKCMALVGNNSATDILEFRFEGTQGGWRAPGTNQLRGYELFSTPFIVPPTTRYRIPISAPQSPWLIAHVRKQANSGQSSAEIMYELD